MSLFARHFPQRVLDPLIRRVVAAPARGRAIRSCHTCRALRLVGAVFCRAAMRGLAGYHVIGAERLPQRGSFILVSNHTSHLDAPALLAALPLSRVNHAYPAAASDYFFKRLLQATAATIFLNALPVERGANGRRNARQMLHAAADLLRTNSSDAQGNVLIVFPEGTRSHEGKIAPFKRGIGELVAGTSIPVVPCRIEGAIDVWPKRFRLPHPWRGTVRVTIGQPMTFADRPRGKTSANTISSELRERIIALSQQTFESRGLQPAGLAQGVHLIDKTREDQRTEVRGLRGALYCEVIK